MSTLNPASWNWNQLKAAGRHFISFAAGGVAIATATHFLSAADADAITRDIGMISDGLTKVVAGFAGLLAVLAPIYAAFKAAHSASPEQEAASLQQAEPVTKIVTSPEIANAPVNVSNPNIVSMDEAKVIRR